MEINKKKDQVALSIVKKYQSRIAKAKSGKYYNQKSIAIYWMCTDICQHTKYFMNDGLSDLFNHLYHRGWIKFACQSNHGLRYRFAFVKGSKFSLTSAGAQALQKLNHPASTQSRVLA